MTQRNWRGIRRLGATVAFAAMGMAGSVALFGQANLTSPVERQRLEENQELMKAQQRLERIDTELSQVELLAMTDPDLRSTRVDYMDKVILEALRNDPSLKEKFARQEELYRQLSGSEQLLMPAEERRVEFNKKLEEFQKLRTELAPIVAEVRERPAVKKRFEQFRSKAREAMLEIEPGTDDLLTERDRLYGQIEALVEDGES